MINYANTHRVLYMAGFYEELIAIFITLKQNVQSRELTAQ